MLTRIFWIVLTTLSLLVGNAVAQLGVLRVTLSSEKAEYIIREPIKCRVTLENVGGKSINIPEIEYLGANMEYMQIRVVRPDGSVQLRSTQHKSSPMVRSAYYTGELLGPGETRQCFLYPVLSNSIGEDENLLTFDEPGSYQVSLCYVVDSFRKVLYGHDSDAICSNEITLVFREPDDVERELLDALWYGSEAVHALIHGDKSIVGRHDVERLRQAMKRHPGHDLLPYLQLAVARSLTSELVDSILSDFPRTKSRSRESGPLDAVPVLLGLMDEYPDFRYEEVRYQLGEAYRASGRTVEATAVYERLLAHRPELRDDYDIMKSYFWSKGNNEERAASAFESWSRSRRPPLMSPPDNHR